MSDANDNAQKTFLAWLRHADFVWSLCLFLLAGSAIAWLIVTDGINAGDYGWAAVVFFLLFALFTITMGYPHPNFGHVSFDRVSQVACLLVLGPVAAAWINGLASLLWPWHRLRHGESLRLVVTASLHNAGLFALVILLAGTLYMQLGGPVPLNELTPATMSLLLLLLVAMQVANDVGMLLLVYLRRADTKKFWNVFSSSVEIVSGLIAVLVAVVFVRMEMPVLVLLLIVLGIGMAVLKQFAIMRQRLERLVDDRTEELRLKSLELERQATHDKLTGLLNRRFADDWLQREIEGSQRADRELTIALADVDHFKQINDHYSHAVGDEVLRRVARILRDRCRKTDIVARYGGEEFLLGFPDTALAFAEDICGQIRAAIANARWTSVDAGIPEDFRITMSFGLAEVGSESQRSGVLNAADSRLYQAKREGRNRIVSGA